MPQINYQSPPNSGGNDGALPAIYDPNWNNFRNLTPAQIVAFKTFPQDLISYASLRRWLAEISGLAVTVTIAGVPTVIQLGTQDRDQARIDKLCRKWAANATATTMFVGAGGVVYQLNAAALVAMDNAVTNYIEQLYAAFATLVSNINATTVTKRSQIDAAYAALAPKSPSALNPGTP